MTFPRVLYPTSSEFTVDQSEEMPDFFVDLNLHQVINAITDRKQEYNLKPLFYTPLQEIEVINYRQNVFVDLENANVLKDYANLFL